MRLRAVIEALTGDAADARGAAIRRLHFEWFVMHSANIKRQLERRTEDAPARLPAVEICARRARLQHLLCPVELDDDHGPSMGLMDLACAIYSNNYVPYIPWRKCTSRAQELEMES